MPLVKDWSSASSTSSHDGSTGFTSDVSDVNVSPDFTYPALSFPEYAEKPLSEQLEPIAVVGMGCRLPGDVGSPSEFWDLMMRQGTGRTPKVPKSRFDIDAHLHPNNERPGSFNVPGGYFLNSSLQEFDPGLFGISTIEAMWMDPQQRKLLEVVYEAFESGGVTLNKVAGTSTACFVGSFTADYQQMSFKEPDFRHSYAATGVDPGIISNRISHVFSLRGPSITVNTACSSSVYALHNACNALRNKECEGAVVGGTNLILTVDQHMNTAKLGVLSPTSTCHTFNAHADGYGRADGVGAVYLKRLQDAIRDGDPIRGIIRSSAVNSNGKAPAVGITHPNLDGQERVIRHAYKRGGDLDPRLTGYFEVHGTGTPIGDPLEVHAVSKAMNDKRLPGEAPLLIGAVKTNIGHSEAASGLSAVIKAVLTVENGIIPPVRGFTDPNPAIDWKNWNVQVVSEPTPFPEHLPVKRVSVNSFGYGGTNGHVIIEGVDSFLPSYKSIPPKFQVRGTFARNRPHLLTFSAHDKPTLARNIDAHGKVVKKYNLLDLSYTLGNRRSRLASRAFVVSSDITLGQDFNDVAKSFAFAEKKKTPTVGFAFTGQGAQWVRMGSDLMSYYPSVLRTIRTLDRALGELPDSPEWTLEDELLADAQTSRVSQAEFSQPLCTAIQIAVTDLLLSWGVKPFVTVGHSSGEIAASYAAGKISAQEAIIVAFYRGKVVRDINTNGSMMAVGLGETAVQPYLEEAGGKVTIACHNSPVSLTLSGDADALETMRVKLDEKKIFARAVKTGGKAYHSAHMRPASAKYVELIQEAKKAIPFDPPIPSKATMVSSVTASIVTPETVIDEHYWTSNLVSPVLFNQAVQKIATDESLGIDMLIEIGPHSALSGPIKQIKSEFNFDKLGYLPTLLRGQESSVQLLKVAGELFLRDYDLEMDRVTLLEHALPGGKIKFERGQVLVDLPTYQWTYGNKSIFAEPRQSAEHRGPQPARHDVLGRRMPGGSKLEPIWRNVLRIKDLPWLLDHSLGGEAVFPAAAYFGMATEAITQMNEISPNPVEIYNYTLRDVSIKTALVTPDDDDGIETLFSLRPSIYGEDGVQSTWWDFNVSSRSQDGDWKEHMTGTIGINTRPRGQKPKAVPIMPQRATGKSWNQALREVGFDYGPTFQDMDDIYFDGKTFGASSKSVIKQECGIMQGESRYALHPASVDSCLQLIIVSIYAGKFKDMTCGAVPIQVDEVAIWPPTAAQLENSNAQAYSWTDERGVRSFRSSTQLVASDGELLMDITDMRSVAYEAAVPQQATEALENQPFQELTWKPDVDNVVSTNTAELVELMSFKNPGASILDLEGHNISSITPQIAHVNYTIGAALDENVEAFTSTIGELKNSKVLKLDLTQDLSEQDVKLGSYDLVFATGLKQSEFTINSVQQLLADGGRAVFKSQEVSIPALEDNGFSCTTSGSDVIATSKTETTPVSDPPMVTLVYRNRPTPLVAQLAEACSKKGWTTRLSALSEINLDNNERVIMVAELEGPLLFSLQEDEFLAIQNIVSSAPSLLWVTSGALLSAKKPEYAMASGLARSITSENASLDFTTFDIDFDTTSNADAVRTITDAAQRQIENLVSRESEYCVSNGKVFISRLLANEELNSTHGAGKLKFEEVPYDSNAPIVGRVNSGKVIFENDTRSEEPLDANEVEIKVTLSGLNKEGVLVIQGQDYPTTFSHEVCGVVTKVGTSINNLQKGDHVVGINFDKYASIQRVPGKLLQKLQQNDSPAELLTLPLAYASALHGLKELAQVEPDENVLILDGSGPAGSAAIRISQLMGAKTFVSVHSESDVERIASEFGLPQERVVSGFTGMPTQIHSIFGKRGINVVFCAGFSSQNVVRECWRHISPFGRVVEAGRKNVLKRSALDTIPLHNGANYFSFDVLDLYKHKSQLLSRLLETTVELYRQGSISPIQPATVHHISELDQAVASFSEGFLQAKALISFSDSENSIKMVPTRPTTQLDANATYFLVGCLGGLGRSLTSWMMEKGARRFAFLSRSGTDSAQAARLVRDIEAEGAIVQVIRGDAGSKEDVERAVRDVPQAHPIKGVVQAAANFQDAIFHAMTYKQWVDSIRPKVTGTMNLHQALANTKLDFFVMTSSTSGILGTPGQANYAAANSFLDSLSRHRISQGQSACSLVLPMVLGVGYVAEHPEIEEALKRKGIYGIDEEHMLQSFEAAVATEASSNPSDHIVVGLDPAELQKSINSSDTTDGFWLGDSRFKSIFQAIQSSSSGNSSSGQSVLGSIKSAATPAEAIAITSEHFTEKLIRLLLLDRDEIQPDVRAIADYGVDSMIGVELRNWIFKELGLDIPFQKLLAPTLTITKFSAQVCENQGIVAA
ncbi:Type I Iterative PKS [Myotisia sp. PD_48]|nr:Type I Iterative PKS [Myotisia sp. PD_48]